MNNAFKHSQADIVQISLNLKESVLRLAIKDNGKVFDATQFIKSENDTDGMGLATYKERVILSGGKLNILSEKVKAL